MKRSCSEWELLVLILSMAASEDEGETLSHLPNCTEFRFGEPSIKIALGIRAICPTSGPERNRRST